MGEKGKGIKKTLIDPDNSMVITRGKGGWGQSRKGHKVGQMVMEGDLTSGGEHIIQYTDNVL